jgi:D-alanyl-lipoteichoic acid acyltransferase DltB (MBOAT superfamily)
MAWGLFKKVVIADRLAMLVNPIYAQPLEYGGAALLAATVFFAFQIYCDFSGYSDIAIGSAQVMGFRLMDNFNRPYFSKSVAEFWKRWHISLSTWFRDYVYFPLGGNRVPKARHCFNIMITFLLSGLWHGASWTFVSWGALNGFYLVFSLWTKGVRGKLARASRLDRFPRVHKYVQVAATFALICFSWIFFRANSLSDAFYIVRSMLGGGWRAEIRNLSAVLSPARGSGPDPGLFWSGVLCILFLMFVHRVQRHGKIRHMLTEKPVWFKWSFYYALVLGIIVFGVEQSGQFIYFQF